MDLKEVKNKIEWIDKRLCLLGQPLTEQQKEYIKFAFVNSERDQSQALDMHDVRRCFSDDYADCTHWQNQTDGCSGCCKDFKLHTF